MINAKVSDITLDDVDDGMNNQMIATEHENLVLTERVNY